MDEIEDLSELVDEVRKLKPEVSLSIAVLLKFSMESNIFEHVREIPTKVHFRFDEK